MGIEEEHDPSSRFRVVHMKIDMVTTALVEVKSALQRLEDSVGVLKLLDVQFQAQKTERERLQRLLEDLDEALGKLRSKLEEELSDSISDLKVLMANLEHRLEAKIQTTSTDLEALERSYDRKIAFANGAIAAVTLLGVAMFTVLSFIGNRYIDAIDKTDEFRRTMEVLKLEDHLRNAIDHERTEKARAAWVSQTQKPADQSQHGVQSYQGSSPPRPDQ